MPPPAPRRQLNVRLSPDLIDMIEADGRAKQDVVADALQAWFSDDSSDDSKMLSDANKENGGGRADDSNVLSIDSRNDSMMIAALTGQLGEKDQQITAKDRQLDAKDRQISELHVLMLQPQLPPAQAAEDGRRWWQFWRKA